MEVTKIKKQKVEAEKAIHAIIKDFEKETQLTVTGIRLRREYTSGFGMNAISIIDDVKIMVEVL